MTQNKRIVLTGGIATGKTTVANLLRSQGIPVIDADLLAREILKKGSPAAAAVIEAFGEGVVSHDGAINRKKLGAIVFSDSDRRARLNAITHPAIRAAMDRELEAHAKEPLVFLDIPLYYEAQDMPQLPVWLVYAPETVQRTRLMKRDGLTEEEADARISAQIDIEEKRQRADRVINNTKDEAHLAEGLRQALTALTETEE